MGSFVRPLIVMMFVATVAAQTRITPPKNKYSVDDDVKVGREAAAEVRRQYPIITESQITTYLDTLGKRLVASAPSELAQPKFEYSFTPVNLKDINAFALPGGPMFVNRGMMEAAKTEGEVAGVMAHELSHVLLRHGTANATKAEKFELGAMAGAIAGMVIGGKAGAAVSQGSQLGIGAYFLKYSREYEKQADLLGAQIMARAGYDPRDLAHMFETIEKQGGSSAPEWLSSHPNPGNRTEYINAEAQQLTVGPRPDPGQLAEAKTHFASLPAPQSMADVEKAAAGAGGGGGTTPAGNAEDRSVGTVGSPVPAPSESYRTVRGGQVFQADVPSNWTALSSNNDVKFVPQNAYGPVQGGQTVMTHGVEFGLARPASNDLAAATKALIDDVLQGNPDMRAGQQQPAKLSNRNAILTTLEGTSAVGGAELVNVYSTLLQDGSLLYFVTVVPQKDRDAYASAFDRIYKSIRLASLSPVAK